MKYGTGTYKTFGRWGCVHITQCRGFVTDGSNPWILLPFITNPLHWVMCTNPPYLQSAQSRLDCQPLPVSIETTSVSLGVDLEAAGHPALTISMPQ